MYDLGVWVWCRWVSVSGYVDGGLVSLSDDERCMAFHGTTRGDGLYVQGELVG